MLLAGIKYIRPYIWVGYINNMSQGSRFNHFSIIYIDVDAEVFLTIYYTLVCLYVSIAYKWFDNPFTWSQCAYNVPGIIIAWDQHRIWKYWIQTY